MLISIILILVTVFDILAVATILLTCNLHQSILILKKNSQKHSNFSLAIN